MAERKGLTARQTVESLTLFFDPAAARGINAEIQFEISGTEPGEYYLEIRGDTSSFHLGKACRPDLTISAPSDVWLKISEGELDGAQAMMEGLYQASGDLDLLVRFNEIFNEEDYESKLEAPPGQRPPGPLAFSGARWMTVAFIPWMIFWFTFDFQAVSRWISLGVPFALSLAIVIYRSAWGKPAWMEAWTVVFFTFALALYRVPLFDQWATVISQLAIAVIWLVTLFRPAPLTCDYIKWGLSERLWDHTLFLHPNAVLTVMWGYQFILAALLGIVIRETEGMHMVLTLVRYGMLIPAFIITSSYPKGAGERGFVWEKSRARLRTWAGVGLILALVLLTWLLVRLPAV